MLYERQPTTTKHWLDPFNTTLTHNGYSGCNQMIYLLFATQALAIQRISVNAKKSAFLVDIINSYVFV